MLLFIAKADAHHLGFLNHEEHSGSTVLSLPATSERGTWVISVVFHRHHVAILLLGNQSGCRSAQPGGQHAVIGAWLTAALHMAGNRNPNLAADDFPYLGPDFIGPQTDILTPLFLLLFLFSVPSCSSWGIFPGNGAPRLLPGWRSALPALGPLGQGRHRTQ